MGIRASIKLPWNACSRRASAFAFYQLPEILNRGSVVGRSARPPARLPALIVNRIVRLMIVVVGSVVGVGSIVNHRIDVKKLDLHDRIEVSRLAPPEDRAHFFF